MFSRGGFLGSHGVKLAILPNAGRFKRPPAGAAARRFLRFFEIFEKIAFFEKLVKIGFLTLFGTIWDWSSDSAWKTGPIHGLKSLFHHFLKSDFFINPGFGYFFTFDGYFEAREHHNRTRHEKIPPGSYYEILWPDGRPEQPPSTSKPPTRYHGFQPRATWALNHFSSVLSPASIEPT